MQVLSSGKVPVKMWVGKTEDGKPDIEDSALVQAENLSNLPFAFKHVALMPDSHMGYGTPIGAVLATKDVVICNSIGVDIGCGMCAIQTKFHVEDIDRRGLQNIVQKVRDSVPVGFNKHHEKQDESLMPRTTDLPTIVKQQYGNALLQLGTLGSGNHFLELQKDSDGKIWIMIHSGSRNLGYKVAEEYNKVAIALNAKWFSSVDPKWELAFLPLDTNEAKLYMEEMQYCVDFALANRKLMMTRTLQAFESEMHTSEVADGDIINIAHNYARLENHYGQNVLVHRKGATSARKGEIGIIPGSQGTKSYIVEGLGNEESFQSCSHGAGRKMGRKMGRKDAQRRLNLDDEKKILDDQGIIHGIRNTDDLDEASGAYKDISVVMENQKDLVSILHELSPLAVVKG